MAREIVIYADESTSRGPLFSNFYGAVAVESTQLSTVTSRLDGFKRRRGLERELKWQRVTEQYEPHYESFVDEIFALLTERRMRMRIMFTQNSRDIGGLSAYHVENRYQILYYQFLKHAFGLQHAGVPGATTRVRLYLDTLPGHPVNNEVFKQFVTGLSRDPRFLRAGIAFPADQIAEVDSSQHVLLQAVDVVLGAMQFRLNRMHERKSPTSTRRGRRTMAKERIYRRINQHVRVLYPGFNIGISTGHGGDPRSRWEHPYRHWLFIPNPPDED